MEKKTVNLDGLKQMIADTAKQENERAFANYWTPERVKQLGDDMAPYIKSAVETSLAEDEGLKKLRLKAKNESAEFAAAARDEVRKNMGKNGAVFLDFEDASCVRTKYFNHYKREDPFYVAPRRADDRIAIDMRGKGLLASLYFEAKLISHVTNQSFESVCKADRGDGGIGAPWFWEDLCNLFEYEKSAGKLKKQFRHSDISKALNITQGTAGGAWLPESFHADIIELARVRSTFLLAGPKLLNVPENGIKMMEETGEVGASYYGENDQVNSSELTVGTREITPHRLATLTSFSNAVIRTGSLTTQFIRDNVSRKHATTIDQKALRGAGGSNEITGLENQATVTQATAGTSVANKFTDVTALRRLIAQNNHSVDRMTCWLSFRTADALHQTENSGGFYPFMSSIDSGRLPRGQTMFESNNIPINLGGGSESLILGASMEYVIWASAPEAAQFNVGPFVYPNSSGTLQSPVATDTSAIYLQEKHDLFLEYPNAAGTITAVAY